MNRLSLVAAAGLAVAASAQPVNTRLAYEVSLDGLSWASTVNAAPGSTVEVRAVISYIGPGTAAGLGQIVFQPVVHGWRASDLLLTWPNSPFGEGIEYFGSSRDSPYRHGVPDEPGLWGRISPWRVGGSSTTSTFLRGHIGTGAAAGMLRIARANITNWIGEGPTSGSGAVNNTSGNGGVQIGQIASGARIPSDPPYDPRTLNVNVLKFGLQLDASGVSRELFISTPPLGLGRSSGASNYGAPNTRWFANLNEAAPSLIGDVEVIGATITVPSPGWFALGLLTAWVRRRGRERGP